MSLFVTMPFRLKLLAWISKENFFIFIKNKVPLKVEKETFCVGGGRYQSQKSEWIKCA